MIVRARLLGPADRRLFSLDKRSEVILAVDSRFAVCTGQVLRLWVRPLPVFVLGALWCRHAQS